MERLLDILAGSHPVTTRDQRLAEFITDRDPPPNTKCTVLCQDHVGTYVLPFACEFEDGTWWNANTDYELEARVVGWLPRVSVEQKRR